MHRRQKLHHWYNLYTRGCLLASMQLNQPRSRSRLVAHRRRHVHHQHRLLLRPHLQLHRRIHQHRLVHLQKSKTTLHLGRPLLVFPCLKARWLMRLSRCSLRRSVGGIVVTRAERNGARLPFNDREHNSSREDVASLGPLVLLFRYNIICCPTYSCIGSSCVFVVHCMWYQRHSSVYASVLSRIVYQSVYKKKTAIRRGNVVYVHTPHPSPTPILYFSSFLKEGWGEIGGRRAKGTSGKDDEEEVGDGMGEYCRVWGGGRSE